MRRGRRWGRRLRASARPRSSAGATRARFRIQTRSACGSGSDARNHLRAHPHVHVGDGKLPAALSLQVNLALDAQCPPPAPPATVIPQSAILTANLSTSLGFGCACGLRGIQQRRRIAPNYRHLMNSSAISRRRFVWLMSCARPLIQLQ